MNLGGVPPAEAKIQWISVSDRKALKRVNVGDGQSSLLQHLKGSTHFFLDRLRNQDKQERL